MTEQDIQPEPVTISLTDAQVEMIDVSAQLARESQERYNIVLASTLAAAGFKGGDIKEYDSATKTLVVVPL